jgi:hypothetical protein
VVPMEPPRRAGWFLTESGDPLWMSVGYHTAAANTAGCSAARNARWPPMQNPAVPTCG